MAEHHRACSIRFEIILKKPVPPRTGDGQGGHVLFGHVAKEQIACGILEIYPEASILINAVSTDETVGRAVQGQSESIRINSVIDNGVSFGVQYPQRRVAHGNVIIRE